MFVGAQLCQTSCATFDHRQQGHAGSRHTSFYSGHPSTIFSPGEEHAYGCAPGNFFDLPEPLTRLPGMSVNVCSAFRYDRRGGLLGALFWHRRRQSCHRRLEN